MIVGTCPYDDCDDCQMRSLPDVPLPVFSKETCPGCGREIWVKYSRIDPEAFTPTQMADAWNIDSDSKSVGPKTSGLGQATEDRS